MALAPIGSGAANRLMVHLSKAYIDLQHAVLTAEIELTSNLIGDRLVDVEHAAPEVSIDYIEHVRPGQRHHRAARSKCAPVRRDGVREETVPVIIDVAKVDFILLLSGRLKAVVEDQPKGGNGVACREFEGLGKRQCRPYRTGTPAALRNSTATMRSC
jgi:hypothetical protein